MELGALDSNDEVANTELSSREKKGKRPSTLRKTRKPGAECHPPLSPSAKAESSEHKGKKRVLLKDNEFNSQAEAVASMSKKRKRIKHAP
jgi:hypothetical protein